MKYALLAAALLCSGCASGIFESKQPVHQTYLITAAPAQPAADAPLPIDLAVARPTVRPGLHTDRIAVHHADRRLDYFFASRWGATSDAVVQSLLVESLRNSGRLETVQSDLSAFSSQYLLQTELRDFQAEYHGEASAPLVQVSFVCTIGRVRGRESLAEYAASASVAAADNTMRSVVAAFESAYRQAAEKIVAQTVQVLELHNGQDAKAQR